MCDILPGLYKPIWMSAAVWKHLFSGADKRALVLVFLTQKGWQYPGASHFSGVLGGRTSGNGNKLHHRNILSKHEEELLKQASQKGGRVSNSRVIKNPAGHCPVQPVLSEPDLAGLD